MSDEQNPTAAIPAAEYQQLKADTLSYYGRVESAERTAKALQAERTAEAISAAVHAVAVGWALAPKRCLTLQPYSPPGCGLRGGQFGRRGRPSRVCSSTSRSSSPPPLGAARSPNAGSVARPLSA